MRPNREQLLELLGPIYQPFQDALTYACGEAARKTQLRPLDSDRKQLLSAMVRAIVFDYFRANPIHGFELDKQAHKNMNPVVLRETTSGMEIRLIRLTSINQRATTPQIPGLAQDPTMADVEGLFPIDSTDPGTVGIAWRTPKFDQDLNPIGPIELTAVRTQPGTKLREGKADFMAPLHGPEHLIIPEAAFDPNDYDYDFTLENQEDAE